MTPEQIKNLLAKLELFNKQIDDITEKIESTRDSLYRIQMYTENFQKFIDKG